MARILGVGIATLDIINTVADFPVEDSEVRATAQSQRRGGNATNTLVVLSQQGHEVTWAGTLANDAGSEFIRAELMHYGVDMSPVQQVAGGRVPTSYVTLNARNGSRTIVHYRDLPEYDLAAFRAIDLTGFDWLHFEGRNVAQTHAMLADARARAPQLPRSVELEKPRDGIAALCESADLLLYSRVYAQANGAHEAAGFLRAAHAQWPAAEHVCSWGEQGAWAITSDGELHHAGAEKLATVVDTLGAGDTFNAGLIHARLSGLGLDDGLRAACRLAGQKCAQQGLDGLLFA